MRLPLIGLGTWDLRGEECARVVRLALELGYRHIDTAYIYQNHQAIRSALQGFSRDQVYLTSKLALEEQVDIGRIGGSIQSACENALQELGVDYLDLYLIHSPNRSFPLDRVFQSMNRLIEQGKVRKIGVSNYTARHLKDLEKTGLVPFANQVEFHPYLYQKELLEVCRSNHIQLISYRPFGKGKLLKEEPLFDQMGSRYKKTGAQVILRWLIQKEICVVPKASSQQHLEENLDIFDFTLTDEEMSTLDKLHRGKRFCRPDNPEFSY